MENSIVAISERMQRELKRQHDVEKEEVMKKLEELKEDTFYWEGKKIRLDREEEQYYKKK